jgi:hypothetical protein
MNKRFSCGRMSFYYVLEKEELSRRQLAHPKPYSYQALELRTGCALPDEEKEEGLSRKQLRKKRAIGYGVKLTFDVPFGKSVGVLTVRACWHDIVFRNELGFTKTLFSY